MNMSKREKILYWFLFLFCFIYIIVRAALVPMIHDEIATFFFYVQTGHFFPPTAQWDANNHFLNTILSHYSFKLFGDSELALRLPNVLSFPIFFYFTFKIGSFLKHQLLKQGFILSLIIAGNFLEFFSICRGYGISMAMLFATIYFLMLALKNFNGKHYLLALLFNFLSLSANMALFNSCAIIFCIILLSFLIHFKTAKEKAMEKFTLLILGIFPLIVFALLSFEYKDRGLLYEGSTEGFWQVCVRSLIVIITNQVDNLYLNIYIVVITIIALVVAIYLVLKQNIFRSIIKPENTFVWLFFGNISACILLAVAMKVNYPSERIALYFFPFFIGTAFFLADQLHSKLVKISYFILSPITLFLFVHFILHQNTTITSCYWPHGILPKAYYDFVLKETNNGSKQKTIGGNITRELVWTWYNYKNNGVLNQLNTEMPNDKYDYLINEDTAMHSLSKFYTQVMTDPYSRYALFKRKKEVEKTLVFESNIQHPNVFSEQEFYTLAEAKTDTLQGKSILIEYEFELENQEIPLNAFLQFSANDSSGNMLVYQRMVVNAFRKEWKGENRFFKHSWIIHDLPMETSFFNTCIWNFNKKSFKVSNSTVKMYNVYYPKKAKSNKMAKLE